VFTRRGFLKQTPLALAVVHAIHRTLWSYQDSGRSSPPPLNRAPRMMQEFLVAQERRIGEARTARIRALRTAEDARAYVEEVRARIRDVFGPLPPKTPLNPRITGVLHRDTYRVEKLLFESRPGFWVTANLYVPEGRTERMPGIIGTCGHSTNGKAADAYQSFAQGLARQGYVVLIYDPIGQGERFQYPGEEGKSTVGPGVREHLVAGNQQLLVGEFFGTWRAWDGIRALDYLLSRPEVDSEQIGVTGNSGGGTMTTWLAALESRWAMAAPSCFVTSFIVNAENELPQDIEQCPPGALAAGLDHEDFLAALAPKPVIILAKEKDYFDVRGTMAAYRRLKHLYTLLGAAENIALFIGPGYHGYTRENREAMYRWFNRATGKKLSGEEPPLQLEKEENLWCTPRGQAVLAGSRTVFSFTREKAEALRRGRQPVSGAKLQQAIQIVLNPGPVQKNPRYRILRMLRRGHPLPYTVPYLIEVEPGIHAWVYRLFPERHYSRPPAQPPRALLYVAHQSADEELRTQHWLREMVRGSANDLAIYACDLRGLGESRPQTCTPGDWNAPYGSDYFYASHSLMLGRPYAGQRLRDLLTVIGWLESIGHHECHLVACGWGAIIAAFAAVLSPFCRPVTLKYPLTSFHDVATSERYAWPLSCLPPGILLHFDLPDCYRALKPRGLIILDPVGADGVPM